MTVLLSYLFYFVAATASPLQRRRLALKRSNDTGQIAFASRVMIITFVLSSLLALFKRPEIHQSISVLALLGLVCAVSGGIGMSAQYIAQRHVEAGVTSLIGNLYTPVTIILATLLLQESLRPLQIAGTLLLLSSVVMVSSNHRLSKWKFDKYFWLMVLSGVSMGIVLTAERALIKENGITAGTWISWGSQALLLVIVAFVSKSKSQYNLTETAVTGGLRFLQQLSWVVLVTVVGNLSLASSITTFKIVVVFVTAAIFLNERDHLKRKILGSLIAVIGLLLAA